uniref:Uncharacterized protein rps12 n=1 Tax=Phalaenopsis aphrodite subsp. formosana TaxID=308872 RepID=Q3BAN0_PHAAO|nr:hypothetical protein PhapfoPp039 [Phalaenopsis aphrodite subsp. formosana]AAW82557.1 hypothetical protein [Phalaenopsis aphrodite subsp. formosana]
MNLFHWSILSEISMKYESVGIGYQFKGLKRGIMFYENKRHVRIFDESRLIYLLLLRPFTSLKSEARRHVYAYTKELLFHIRLPTFEMY